MAATTVLKVYRGSQSIQRGIRVILQNSRTTGSLDTNIRYTSMCAGDVPDTEEPDRLPRKRRGFRNLRSQLSKENRHNPEMERAARLGILTVELDKVHQEWLTKHGSTHVGALAKHSGIFEHVCEEFTPNVLMNIRYREDKKVHWGNFIAPSEASCQPEVHYESDENGYWTLLLTNPDGNIWEDTELLHWMVGNIPAGRVSDGIVLSNYVPPIPPQGTGFHRYVFCLLRQKSKLDLSEYGAPKSGSIANRSFSTAEFLHRQRGKLTLAGLSFFQAAWDESVTNTFTENIGIAEPLYKIKPFVTPTAKRRKSTKETFSNKYRNM